MICIFLLPVNLQKYKILGYSEIKIASYMRSIFLFNIKFAIVYAWIEIEYAKSRNIFDLMIIGSKICHWHIENLLDI